MARYASIARDVLHDPVATLSLQLKNKYGDAFIRGNNGKSC